jgi:glycosyltransferase involved in cell wall biosynthesis
MFKGNAVYGEKKIRVLRIIARMNVGGPAIQVSNLEQYLDNSIFEHMLITGECERDEIDYLDINQLPMQVKRVSGLGRSINPVKDILAFFTIRRAIQEFQPHIIHTHTAKAGFLGRLAAFTVWKEIYLVHTFHGHLLTGYFSTFKTKIVVVLEIILARYTHALIAVGNKVRDDLISAGIGDDRKFTVINPGLEISVSKSRDVIRGELKIQKSSFVICWLGRMAPIKRPERLIEIAKVLNHQGFDFKFLMIGGGALYSTMETLAQDSQLPIILTGWRTDVGDLLNASDLLLLTSDNEGTPIAIIQAQMLGVPVLATDVGSVKEVLIDGKSGYAKTYDAAIFSEIIQKFAKNAELRQIFKETALKFSSKSFSIESFVNHHEKLYRELTSTNLSN